MKYLIKHTQHRITFACLSLWAAAFIGFFIPAQVAGENSVADEIISLNVTDRPLGEVLENLSIAANCRISIDESWQDYPITASFDDEPLYRGLKLILRHISNAVVYGRDRTVKIIVFDDGTADGKSSGRSFAIRAPTDAHQQPAILGDATAPQAEVEIFEKSDDADEGGQQLEEADESGAESNTVDAENKEPPESESIDASSEQSSEGSELEEKQSDPEAEGSQSEDTEGASSESEDSESLENNEEADPN
jgi:hypothetical protein